MWPSTDDREVTALPRLLAFCHDVIVDGDDYASAYRNVAVGVRWHDGTCVTMQDTASGGPPTVTVWSSVDDAIEGLDAYVCGFAPQRAARESHSADMPQGEVALLLAALRLELQSWQANQDKERESLADRLAAIEATIAGGEGG